MALLNTHAIVKKFISYGFTEDQAEAVTDAINAQNQELATKTDIAILRSDMNNIKTELKAEILEVRAELKSEISEVKSEIQNLGTELRADIRTLRADGLWLKGTLLVILGLLAKLVFFSKI